MLPGNPLDPSLQQHNEEILEATLQINKTLEENGEKAKNGFSASIEEAEKIAALRLKVEEKQKADAEKLQESGIKRLSGAFSQGMDKSIAETGKGIRSTMSMVMGE